MRTRAGSRLLAGSRGRAAAAAALLPALALAAGCGGGGGGKPHAVRASGAVGAADLTQALLASSDVPHVQVLPAGSKDQLLGGSQKADPSTCQPVADQWSSRPAHPRQVYAGAMLTDTAAAGTGAAGKDTKDTKDAKGAKTISLTVVASYKKGEARQVVDALSAALKTCTSYRTTRNGTTTSFTVKAVPPAQALGDQQVTYTIGDSAKGQSGTALVTVIRVGDTTAAYETVRADHRPAALRPAIALKQVAKLRTAAAAKG